MRVLMVVVLAWSVQLWPPSCSAYEEWPDSVQRQWEATCESEMLATAEEWESDDGTLNWDDVPYERQLKTLQANRDNCRCEFKALEGHLSFSDYFAMTERERINAELDAPREHCWDYEDPYPDPWDN